MLKSTQEENEKKIEDVKNEESLDYFFENQPKIERKIHVIGETCTSCEG